MTSSTNGHFVLTGRNLENQTYTATILEQKMDKILMNRYSGQLVDENGFRYDFDNKDAAICPGIGEYTDLSESMIIEKTAWPMRSILSPYGKSISFDYVKYSYTNVRDRKDSNASYFKVK